MIPQLVRQIVGGPFASVSVPHFVSVSFFSGVVQR